MEVTFKKVEIGGLVLDGREVRDERWFLVARIELRGEFHVVTAPSGKLYPVEDSNSFVSPVDALWALANWRLRELIERRA